jgi:hypothetical protein
VKQFLLMGTAVVALAALAVPAQAYDRCEVSRNRRVVRHVQSLRPVSYRNCGSRYSRPTVRTYRTRTSRPDLAVYNTGYSSSGSCYSEPVRTVDYGSYGAYNGYGSTNGYRRSTRDRLERARERARIRGYRARSENRRWRTSGYRSDDRPYRVRRVGWGTRYRDCR